MNSTETKPVSLDKSLAGLVSTIYFLYGNFAYDKQHHAEAPVLTLACTPRSDGRLSREQMIEKLLNEAAALAGNFKREKIFTNKEHSLVSAVTTAAAPHTPEIMEKNGITYPAQEIVWLLNYLNTNQPLSWGRLLEQGFTASDIAQVLAQGVESAVFSMVEAKQIDIETALKEFIRIYYLSGYSTLAEREQDGKSRGAQSAQDLHVHVAWYDRQKIKAAKKLGVVTPLELVKQLSPMNTIFMRQCGSAVRAFIDAHFLELNLNGVHTLQTGTYEASRDNNDLGLVTFRASAG